MNDAQSSLIFVDELKLSYPVAGGPLRAVRGVSLEIHPGEIVAIVGESGSGKTTLARAVLGLLPFESGHVHYRGLDSSEMNHAQRRGARRNMQAVFQDPLDSLSPRRTILQTLLEPLDHFRIGSRAERRTRAAAALETVELPSSLLWRFPHELSGGQRQRVALARALVAEPELIVADEPLSSLDTLLRNRIIDLIAGLRRRLGIAFLLVSHDLSLVRQLADTVGVMYLGTLVEMAPTEALFARPAHPYTRSLLAAVPVPDPHHPRPAVLGGEPPSALTPPAGCVFHKCCAERLAACDSIAPQESLAPEDTEGTSSDRQTPFSQHRVRCHLWSS